MFRLFNDPNIRDDKCFVRHKTRSSAADTLEYIQRSFIRQDHQVLLSLADKLRLYEGDFKFDEGVV
jgi:hypothetical protein